MINATISYCPRQAQYTVQEWVGKGIKPIEPAFEDFLSLVAYCERKGIEITEQTFDFNQLSTSDFCVWMQTAKTGVFKTDLFNFILKLVERETEYMRDFNARKQEVLSGRG